MNDRRSVTLMTDYKKKLSLEKALFYGVYRVGMTEMTEMTGKFYFIKNLVFWQFWKVGNVKIKRNRKKLSFLSFLSLGVIS